MAPVAYSDSEITSAVSGLVQSNVRVTRDALGPIDLGAQFDEVVRLLSTTLIFDSNAIFYLLYLVTNKLNSDILAALSAVEDLQIAITEVGKSTKSITKTSLLGDAAAALTEVDAVLSTDMSVKVSAYERYRKAVDAFRDVSLRPNIVGDGQIVRPPQAAVQAAIKDLAALRTAYPDILKRIDGLTSYVDGFMGLRLPAKSAQQTVNQTRRDLSAMQQVFESGLSDDEKISLARDAYLRLAAGKAVLSNIRVVSDPRDPRVDARFGSGFGAGMPEPVSPGVVTPATKICSHSGPWKISTANRTLVIREDDQANTTYTLPLTEYPSITSDGLQTSYVLCDTTPATLIGTVASTFTIPVSPNNLLKLLIGGVIYSVNLTEGVQSIATVLSEISSIPGLSSVVTVSNDGAGHIKFVTVGSGSQYGVIVRTLNSDLGFAATNAYATGTDYNRVLYVDDFSVVLAAGTRTTSSLVQELNTAFGTQGRSYLASSPDGKKICIARQDGYLKMVTSCPLVGQSLNLEAMRTYATLGFYNGQSAVSHALSAVQIADTINAVGKVTAIVEREIIATGADCSVLTNATVAIPYSTVLAPVITAYQQGTQYTLDIGAGPNQGSHRIISLLDGRPNVTFTLDPENLLVAGQPVAGWIMVREQVRITSKALQVKTALWTEGSAAVLMGFPSALARGLSTALQVRTVDSNYQLTSAAPLNLKIAGVVAGDIATLYAVDGVAGDSYTVSFLSNADSQLELEAPGTITYPNTTLWLIVYSRDAISYQLLMSNVALFADTIGQGLYASSTAELERRMNPLLSNRNPSDAQINAAIDAASDVYSILDAARILCEAFDVRAVPRIDAAMKMLQERGLDAAYNILVAGDLPGFFAMDKDDASTSAAMLKASRTVAQNDVPVSKVTDSADMTRTHQTTVYTPDASYSDADISRDESFHLVGDNVVLDSDDPAADTVQGKVLSG